jgi:hypothetical protein
VTELLRALEGTLSCWPWLNLQSLAPTNQHWARVMGYGPFSLCVIHKKGLCIIIISLLMPPLLGHKVILIAMEMGLYRSISQIPRRYQYYNSVNAHYAQIAYLITLHVN